MKLKRLLSHVVRRLLSTLVVMFWVAVLVFTLLHLSPGDPAVILAGDFASPEHVAKLRQQLGLDQPLVMQFANWMLELAKGNLGHSVVSRAAVTTLIAERLGPTLSLSLLTLSFAVPVGILIGAVAALRPRSAVDQAVMGFSVLGFSLPSFVVAYFFIYVFAIKLAVLPVQGYTPLSEGAWPWLRNLILPAISLGMIYLALIARMTRAALIETLNQDFIRTARAKGAGTSRVLLIHALRNAGVPIITTVGIGFALLIGGVVVTETVFNLPGLGRLVVDSVTRRDYPVVQGVTLLLSFIYVAVNFLVDISYTAIDPRLRDS